MTLTVEEIVGIVIVAVALGAVIAAIWDVGMAERAASLHYSRGCTATRASLRDALTTLPRLHCSRSAAGHVRVADVERLLVEPTDG